ncbi:hypothetical protein PRUPE_6G184100, partial [Prunus persica]
VNGNGYGFYNSSYGENPDQVYAIGLCRGDVTVDNCRGCLSNATQRLTQDCPNQKEAFGVIEQCTLRYSNRSIYGAMETFPALMWYNPQNVTSDVDGFFQELKTLLEDLRGQAAGNGSLRKFAAETATAINFQTIYGLAQCTPDLTEQVCSDCLGSSLADIPKYFQGMQGAVISKPSCNVSMRPIASLTLQLSDHCRLLRRHCLVLLPCQPVQEDRRVTDLRLSSLLLCQLLFMLYSSAFV